VGVRQFSAVSVGHFAQNHFSWSYIITAPTPTGFAEIIRDYFPILHPVPGNSTHDSAGGS
jgi:hypothetical protein